MFLITSIDKAKQTLPKKIIFPDCYYIEYKTVYNESKQISLYILNDGKLFHENFKVEFTHKSFVLLNYNSNAENVSYCCKNLIKIIGFLICLIISKLTIISYIVMSLKPQPKY